METITKRMTAAEMDEKMDGIEEKLRELTKSRLIVAGKEYKLDEWITTSEFAKKNGLAIARVHNWITRHVIPTDCVLVIPELNHLKLIKNQTYQTRAVK